MKKQIEEFNKLASQHSKLGAAVIGGILALTLAFGIGRLTAPVDRETICQKYTDDITKLEGQLAECRRLKVSDCDARLRECHEQERAACQESLNQFRARCEELACQE